MSKFTVKAIAGVLVVFMLGIITGAVGMGLFIRHNIREFAARGSETPHKLLMNRLTRELKLTDAQLPQAEAIIVSGEQEFRRLLNQSHTEFTGLMQREVTELKTMLTPEQQQRLDQIIARLKKRWPSPLQSQ